MATLPTLLQHASAGKDTQLHLLPFHVSYAGPARVSSYFTPEPSSSSSSSSSTAYFRGRLLRGVEVQLPDGYAGQLWRSNAPSVSVSASTSSSSSHKNASTSAASGTMNEEYNADSPRRSPRKHAQSADSRAIASAPADKKQKTGSTSANVNVAAKKMTGKNKPKAAKRQRFAMSPDASPVKEEETNGGQEDDGVTDIPQEAAAMLIDNDDVAIAAKKEEQDEEQVDSDKSSPAIKVATSPAKPVLAQPKDEAVEDSATAATATSALARENTPPPPPSTPALIPPSTPASASAAALPIHVLSPSTPRTPNGRGSSSIFGNNAFQSPTVDNVDANIDSKRTHQRLIQPIAHFGKITIWNPDVELDAGDDCYVKTLAEWPMLAELIHA